MKISLVLLSVLVAQAAWAFSTDFNDQMKTLGCTSDLKSSLTPKLMKQSWIPINVSIPNLPLMSGIGFRDSLQMKAHRIWSDGNSTFYAVADLKTAKEQVKSWNAKSACKVQVSEKQVDDSILPKTTGFTDQDLMKELHGKHWGVIYVWTPYMPLSVDGVAEIEKAVKAQGGSLTVLVDAKASAADIQAWVKKGKIKPSQETAVASKELYARDLGEHYPVAFIFENGFLSNRSYIGYKDSKMFGKWITLERAEIKKDMN